MKELSFKLLQQLCESNVDKRHVRECLEAIKNSEGLFFPGIVMPNDHIASLYELRLGIAKERSSFGKDYIRDFEYTVANLQASSSEQLALAGLYARESNFLIFYEPDTKTILGVLKTTNIRDLNTKEQSTEEIINKYASPGLQKYCKGELVKE
jgi:hypothetical protein